MYLLIVVFLLMAGVLIIGVIQSSSVQREFEKIKPLDEVEVKLYSPDCWCWRKGIAGNRDGKLIQAFMTDQESKDAVMCKFAKGVDCWCDVDKFDKWSIKKQSHDPKQLH